jgi:hypothetical protein
MIITKFGVDEGGSNFLAEVSQMLLLAILHCLLQYETLLPAESITLLVFSPKTQIFK